jgi:hypothetical protein
VIGVRVEYTIIESDADDNEIHREQGPDSGVRYGDLEDARSLVTDWVPVEAGAETWRAPVRGEDGHAIYLADEPPTKG